MFEKIKVTTQIASFCKLPFKAGDLHGLRGSTAHFLSDI